MIQAVTIPAHKQAFATAIQGAPYFRAVMGRDLALWADNTLNRKQSTSRSIITNITDKNSTLLSKDVCLSTSKAKKSSSIKETVFILTLNFHMA